MKKNSALYKFRRKIQVLAFNIFSPETLSKFYFKLLMKSKLHLDNPVTFNEKIQWLKLYDYPFNDLIIKCTDKYAVREYVSSKGLNDILNDIIFVTSDTSKIEWDKLPDKFAVKCTHGCGYNIIVDDKSTLNKKKTTRALNKWMKEKFGKFNAELHYNEIEPRIICEKYLGKNLVDYKFYCFNGEPKFLYMSTGFNDWKDIKVTFYNIDKSEAEFGRTDYKKLNINCFPEHYEEMVEIAKVLSKDFLFVRVDLYEFEDKVYFGELTFTPAGGLMKIEPESYDKLFGSFINLDELIQIKKNRESK